MTVKKFKAKVEEKDSKGEEITQQWILNQLIDHFLGENWYSSYWNQDDINVDAAIQIISDTQSFTFMRWFNDIFERISQLLYKE